MARKMRAFDSQIVEAEENLLIDVQFLIQDLIDRKGISRTELAAKAGISKARLSQLMAPEANPTLKSVAGIFLALGEEMQVSSRKKRAAAMAQHQQREVVGGFEWRWDSAGLSEVDVAANAQMAAVVKEAVVSNDNYRRQVVVWHSEQETVQLEAA